MIKLTTLALPMHSSALIPSMPLGCVERCTHLSSAKGDGQPGEWGSTAGTSAQQVTSHPFTNHYQSDAGVANKATDGQLTLGLASVCKPSVESNAEINANILVQLFSGSGIPRTRCWISICPPGRNGDDTSKS